VDDGHRLRTHPAPWDQRQVLTLERRTGSATAEGAAARLCRLRSMYAWMMGTGSAPTPPRGTSDRWLRIAAPFSLHTWPAR
jgi:hypothetical protein